MKRQTSKPQTLLFIQNNVGFLVIFVSVLNQQMTRIVIAFVILMKGKREKTTLTRGCARDTAETGDTGADWAIQGLHFENVLKAENGINLSLTD